MVSSQVGEKMKNPPDDATSRTPALPCEPKDPKATLEALQQPGDRDASVNDGMSHPADRAASATPRA